MRAYVITTGIVLPWWLWRTLTAQSGIDGAHRGPQIT
jgi:hypothetical protein